MKPLNVNSWCFLGVLAPPFGGVTIFGKRKVSQWRREGKPVIVIDISKISPLLRVFSFFRILFLGRKYGIYINNLSGFYLVSALLNFRGAQVFYHDHNYDLSPLKGLRGMLLWLFLRRCVAVYFDGEHSRLNYISAGYLAESKEFFVSTPFLPPDLSERDSILSSYPLSLAEFIDSHSPLIGANAFKVILTNDGVDLYGVDMVVQFLESYREFFPSIGVVFAISVDDGNEYLMRIKERIEIALLSDSVYFFTGSRELWPLFDCVDVMVRPTVTDGYGISIAEALFLGTPAIASDVCARPQGTILFRSRDQDDFDRKLLSAIKSVA